MSNSSLSRRGFIASTLAGGSLLGSSLSGVLSAPQTALGQEKPRHKVERIGIGAIGLRYQGSVIANKAQLYGDIVAVCDVDRNVRDQAKAAFGSTPYSSEDYHELIARKDVDVVTIGSPDHWHTKMVIDACRAGKDVYCEKPLTLTIDEGKLLTKVVKETGRVVQVGSWQRSDDRFRQAVEMVRAGRIGRLQKVDVVLGKNATSGSFVPRTPPAHLKYANGVMMTVGDTGDNGILFTGDAGRMFVNRGKITGAPVEALSTNPLNRVDWKVYDYDNLERPPRAGKLDAIVNHMGNFFDCVQSRRTPVSDVVDSHRTVSTCHLGNISMRLGRPLKWDPIHEEFFDDKEANTWLKREQRKGFETV